jgi:hypothetical protein
VTITHAAEPRLVHRGSSGLRALRDELSATGRDGLQFLKPKTYEPGRICGEPECRTVLSVSVGGTVREGPPKTAKSRPGGRRRWALGRPGPSMTGTEQDRGRLLKTGGPTRCPDASARHDIGFTCDDASQATDVWARAPRRVITPQRAPSTGERSPASRMCGT